MPRPSVPNLLFDRFLERFRADGWTISKSLIARTGPDRNLAECYPEERRIVMYPVIVGERDDPPARNLFHEILIHIGLGFGPEVDWPSPDAARIEAWWWAQLSTTRKAQLAKLLEG